MREQLEGIFRDILSFDGIIWALLLTEQGEVPAALRDLLAEQSADLKATIAIGVGAMQTMSRTISGHQAGRILFEIEENKLLLTPIHETWHFAVFSDGLSSGMLLAQAGHWKEQLLACLQESSGVAGENV